MRTLARLLNPEPPAATLKNAAIRAGYVWCFGVLIFWLALIALRGAEVEGLIDIAESVTVRPGGITMLSEAR